MRLRLRSESSNARQSALSQFPGVFEDGMSHPRQVSGDALEIAKHVEAQGRTLDVDQLAFSKALQMTIACGDLERA